MIFPDFDTFRALAREGNLVPVYRELLADTETPVTALLKLRAEQNLFLLESVEGSEKWGRYTFLGSSPRLVFRVRRGEVLIEENGESRVYGHGGDPLRFLKDILGRYRPVALPELPRFFGGAVGYLGYDMVRFFERKLDRGVSRAGETDDAVFLLTDTLLVFDNVRHTLKVVSCARTDEGADLRRAYDEAAGRIEEMVARLQAAPAAVAPPRERTEAGGAFAGTVTEEAFRGMVTRAKEYIVAGDVIQVVLSQRFERPCSVDPVNLYRALRYVNPSPYLFFLKVGGFHLIGSSPEVMVRLEEGIAELKPIAGTRRRGATEQEDRRLADELLRDPKEKAEHVMLVDLGRNDLGRIARTGSVQVSQLMAVERYSHVMHLVSDIRAQVAEGRDAFDVLRAAFPAGTLTGAPKVRAMEIIDELEKNPRGPYGGAVGYVSYTGNMDLGITIRTMMLRDGLLSVQAGAGIVADSDPRAEYEETLHKAGGMFRAVALAENGFLLNGGAQ
jgi:anthranilate synthase component 1